jgi:hypothetical protein
MEARPDELVEHEPDRPAGQAHVAIEAMRAAMVRGSALRLPAPTDLLPAGRRVWQRGPRRIAKGVEDQREVPAA